jgi:hypothetical protein
VSSQSPCNEEEAMHLTSNESKKKKVENEKEQKKT